MLTAPQCHLIDNFALYIHICVHARYLIFYPTLFCHFSICEELEEMSMKAGERPEETPEVVALQNYINDCREMRIFAIKDEIKNVLKRVVFLLTHTYLSSE